MSLTSSLRCRLFAVALLACFVLGGFSRSAARGEDGLPAGPINLPAPTLGGTQLWTDLLLFRDWRIQQNALTGHCRLLDGTNIRRAWGDFDHCHAKLEDYKRELDLPPMRGKAVILIHGLLSMRYTMKLMGRYLDENSDYTVLYMTYASSRRSIDDHAVALHSVLSHLDGVEEVNFVGHSLGNIVVRRYLAMQDDPDAGKRPDPRIRRIVMCGPPNNGSNMAARFDVPPISTIGGDPFKSLGDNWDEIVKGLATPTCEFGIIAGDLSESGVDNPLIPGGDDLLVGVEEARLPGARDFLVLPLSHVFMECDRQLQEHVLTFLEHGYFRTADTREPILAPIARVPQTPAP